MSWFSDVTGRSSYSQQSWRDNYNGGKAAGDWTGGVNAQLDRERAAFQGATWIGSSLLPSALEVARLYGFGSAQTTYAFNGKDRSFTQVETAPARPATSGPSAPVAGASATAGPGNAAASAGAEKPTAGPGATGTVTIGPITVTPGNIGTGKPMVELGPAPLKEKTKLTATGGFAGFKFEANPWFSHVENWGEPRYGEPGEWLGGILNIGADLAWNTGRAADAFERSVDRAVTRYGDDTSWGSTAPMAPTGKPGSLNW